MPYVVGVDFGTLSGRAVVVRVADGTEVGSAVHEYAHGAVERALPGGRRLPPSWALQVPQDWRDVLREAIRKALAVAGVEPADVVGIGTDFTACTVLPTLADGTPLCEVDGLEDRPHAYPKLWKHHAAQGQADRINALAAARGEPWLRRYGGRISAEWQFAKGLQVLDEDPEIYDRAARWIEAADWIIWELCGVETRNVCTAGYKGIHQDGAYPSPEYLTLLDPRFAGFVDKLRHPLSALGGRAGSLTARAAALTGLPEGIAVAVGNVDAHVTAPAARAVEPGQLVAIMGTSTCHVLSSDRLASVPGMCGVVEDGIVEGLWGYEAGQSGVGDIFGWFAANCVPPSYVDAATAAGVDLHDHLSALAAAQPVGAHGLVALDWHSGNRSVLVDHALSGVILGQTLATRPEEQYRALVEATAFGTRMIVETFETAGVPVTEVVAAGGLIKNAFLMQVYADVLRRPISVIGSAQGPALGSAIHAAVAAGHYPDVRAAAAVMGSRGPEIYRPEQKRADAYDPIYADYRELHDHFGRGGSRVLHRLHARRAAA
ncbi:ribulokinase [Asanoa ishikariensis]|uniref:Ribulokinase n=1 Tax=Asanoa ishikariensis TaxID=137265 RepID=A0A1H3L6B2_9ACTN|nr:ribulokinase [Asanoa ishikariensis]SDY59415.1 L-ribulokinase [Asanoa ishikariensis]